MSAGATVKVNYYDTTTGKPLGERFELTSHDLVSGPQTNFNDRIIITRIHNAVNAEVVVTGGTVELGLYVTLVAYFASDFDFVKDGQIHDPAKDVGLPAVCLDEATNTLNFLRCLNGFLTVNPHPGTPFYSEATVNTSIGASVDVFTFTVPASTTRKIETLKVVTEVPGRYTLDAGGSEIAAGLSYESEKNLEFKFSPPRPISEGTVVTLKYEADSGFNYSCPVSGFLMASDFT
jgi:hypothetical protein